ncbi:hypothetical protein D3C76_593800 [compost metagenome]
MPGALFDQLEQAVDAGGVDDVVAHVLQRQLRLLRVHRVDRVPGGKVQVIAGRHEGVALHPAAIAEQRHHALQAELLVEVGAANVHAAGGEDVGLAVGDVAALRRQAHQGEVRGTAADVDDQHQFLALDAALVVEGRGDRFVLERHFAEADLPGHLDQGVGSFPVGLLVVIDEEHRAAQHDGIELAPGSRLATLLQLAEEQPEQVLERQRAAQHGGFALQQAGAQQALQRAHQAAFVAFQVFVQGQAAVHRAAFLDVEEHHRRQGDPAVLQYDQRLRVRAPPADGGIGSAEVDAQGAGRSAVLHDAKGPGKKRPRSLRERGTRCSSIERMMGTKGCCKFDTVYNLLIKIPLQLDPSPCKELPTMNCVRPFARC